MKVSVEQHDGTGESVYRVLQISLSSYQQLKRVYLYTSIQVTVAVFDMRGILVRIRMRILLLLTFKTPTKTKTKKFSLIFYA
jgi:hypothetical protein